MFIDVSFKYFGDSRQYRNWPIIVRIGFVTALIHGEDFCKFEPVRKATCFYAFIDKFSKTVRYYTSYRLKDPIALGESGAFIISVT